MVATNGDKGPSNNVLSNSLLSHTNWVIVKKSQWCHRPPIIAFQHFETFFLIEWLLGTTNNNSRWPPESGSKMATKGVRIWSFPCFLMFGAHHNAHVCGSCDDLPNRWQFSTPSETTDPRSARKRSSDSYQYYWCEGKSTSQTVS